MKKCFTELMKDLKSIHEEINTIKFNEIADSLREYSSQEEKIPTTYDYDATRELIDSLQKMERQIKSILAKKNIETIVEEYNMSISECIVYLAQLNENKRHLLQLTNQKQLTRKTSSYTDRVNYVECLYDVKEAKKEYIKICKEITNLQMAIDRTNLNNFVDFD